MYKYRYKPSKDAAREFAQKMAEIEAFCVANHIDHSASYDSYYFSIAGQKYRVSNHSIAQSVANGARDYHPDGCRDDTIYILAGKTRIIDIYNGLKAGYKLDGRGRRVQTA